MKNAYCVPIKKGELEAGEALWMTWKLQRSGNVIACRNGYISIIYIYDDDDDDDEDEDEDEDDDDDDDG